MKVPCMMAILGYFMLQRGMEMAAGLLHDLLSFTFGSHDNGSLGHMTHYINMPSIETRRICVHTAWRTLWHPQLCTTAWAQMQKFNSMQCTFSWWPIHV